MRSKPKQVFDPEGEPFNFDQFVEGLWLKAPISITREVVDEGLERAGINPDTARKLVRLLVDQESDRLVFPDFDPPAVFRIVSDHIKRSVDELIDAGAPVDIVRLICQGISDYVIKKIEYAKRSKRQPDQKSPRRSGQPSADQAEL